MLEEIKKFYEKTKFKFGELQKLPKGIEVPLNWIRVFYKTYPRFPKIELKIPEKETEFSKLLKKEYQEEILKIVQ